MAHILQSTRIYPHHNPMHPQQKHPTCSLQLVIQEAPNLTTPTHNPTITVSPYKVNTYKNGKNTRLITFPLPHRHCSQPKSLSQSIYIDGSFIPPKGEGNVPSSSVYSLINDIQIVERLLCFQNILGAKLYAVWLALANTQNIPHKIHIFKDNLNNIYLINNHILHPSTNTTT